MKVVFVSTLYPYPANVGKKVVITGLIRFFCEKFSSKNFYLLCPETFEINSLNHKFKITNYKLPGIFIRLLNIIFFTFLFRKKSIQESLFFSSSILKTIQSSVDTIEPDLIIFDTIRMGQYLPYLDIAKAKKVLYLEDLFSVRYQSMIRALELPDRRNFNPLGNFERHVPKVIRGYIKKFSFLQKLLLSYESNLVAKSEIAQSKIFTNSLLINKAEAQLLASRTGRAIQVVPPSISASVRPYGRVWNGSPVFVFLGGLDVPHNAVSIEGFLHASLEKIIKEIPDVLIRIIGKNPSTSLIELVNRFPKHVRIEGYIDSLDEVLYSACAMLIPLVFGSGVKLKTIDALSYGLPIIATDFGIEGVDVSESADHCIVENDLSRYQAWMVKLLDPEYNKKIAMSSYDFYVMNYSEESINKQYSELFKW